MRDEKEIEDELTFEPPTRPSFKGRSARKKLARWRATLDTISWLADKVVQVEESLLRATNNSAAEAALYRRAESFREKFDRALKEAPDVLEGAPASLVRQWLGANLEEWPDVHLEDAMRIYAERHAGRILFIGEGGHRSELADDGGWKAASE